MAAVRQKDTTPETIVRGLLHALGYRFRLHDRRLPGSPDIILPRLKTVIFVHGCFWHRHGCSRTTTPATRRDFWVNKFKANVMRDRRAARRLRAAGWSVITIWECQAEDPRAVERRLTRCLERR
jgi:DNA mismatch endonuclease, patch repair protein